MPERTQAVAQLLGGPGHPRPRVVASRGRHRLSA